MVLPSKLDTADAVTSTARRRVHWSLIMFLDLKMMLRFNIDMVVEKRQRKITVLVPAFGFGFAVFVTLPLFAVDHHGAMDYLYWMS